jgi:ADP-dependent NAD(P)H-hydrate dehydratase / NAD(P)H-hydrate epimerase
MKLVSVAEMYEIEQAANAANIPNDLMMAHAGKELAKLIIDRFSASGHVRVIGLIGKGNNGGDTLVAMNELLKDGWQCTAVFLVQRSDDPLFTTFIGQGGRAVLSADQDFDRQLKEALVSEALVLDGVLGTGFKSPMKADVSQFLKGIKKYLGRQFTIAVDCPSGVDCESGEVSSETLPADLTVCMEAVKVGLVKEPAFLSCGEIVVVPLGLPRSVVNKFEKKSAIDWQWAAAQFPQRSVFSHKGTFGKVMISGGSVNYPGSVVLSGLAAYRMGSGLVTLAVPHSVAVMMAGGNPEITWVILDEEDGVIAETAEELFIRSLKGFDCLVLGPGIGQEETTRRFLQRLLIPPEINNHRKVGFLEGEPINATATNLPPLVLDAEALRWLAAQKNWEKTIHTHMVLTPHPGEMAALTDLSTAEVQNDRINCATTFAQKWQQVVVLKGALTIVAAPDGRINVIPVATSALAKAGSGDVLSGMIASLIGQGLPLFEAATLAAWLHAQAGLLAAQEMGNDASLLAREIIAGIPGVISRVQKR